MENLFKNLGLSEGVLESIEKLGYTTPSKIQELLIPIIMNGSDALGQAQTGTGKTLAFAASILSKIQPGGKNIKAMILSPTRELAIQISKEFQELDINNNFKSMAVYGGSDISRQISKLKDKPDIVIGTPGRVKDLIERGKLNLTTINFFVLDEADEMLNMGFIEDIEEILSKTSRDKQVLMLSATMPKQIKNLINKYMREDYESAIVKAETKTAANISQNYYVVSSRLKFDILCRILDSKQIGKAIIFAKTKATCDDLTADLQGKGYLADVIHSDISQNLRLRTLDRFKSGKFQYLVATDVAARGIHIDNVDLVINYQLPQEKEAYVHRIGRTGRASATGEAINLITQKERDFLRQIEKFTKSTMTEQPIPQKTDILEAKYNQTLQSAYKMIAEKGVEDSLPYVVSLSKGELLNLSAALLKMTVEKQIGSDMDKELVVRERAVRDLSQGTARVFLNVGKKDKLKKQELLQIMNKSTKISKETFTNIEILETFTFVDIAEESLEEFIEKFTGENINGRIVNAEKSTHRAKGSGRRNDRKPRGKFDSRNNRGGRDNKQNRVNKDNRNSGNRPDRKHNRKSTNRPISKPQD